MVSSTRQAIAGFFIIFGVAVLAHAQTTPVKELTSTVSGRITVKDKPVPGIAVGLRVYDQSRSTPVVHRGNTDANGEYRISNVPAGTYLTSVTAPAFVWADEMGGQRTLIISKGETIEHIDFRLLRGGVITGKVVDSDGRPLVEQQISIIPENESGSRGYYPYTLTDDRGIYRAFGVAPGTYRVAAGNADDDSFGARFQAAFYRRTYHPNVLDPSQAKLIQVSEGSEATNVDIILSRTVNTYTASGRIVDEAGQPVPNIPYAVTQFVNANSTHSMTTGAVSNGRGEFKLEKLMAGSYAASIRMEAPSDLRADPVRFEITDQDVTGLVITIRKAGSVSGVVIIEGGSDDKKTRELLTKTGISVAVAGPNPDRGGFGHFTFPAADGSFRIDGLSAGAATFYISTVSHFRIVRVERDGVIQPRGVEIKEKENVTGVRIIATYANASVRGTIEVENGTVPANAHFSVWLTKLGEEPGSPNFSPHVSTQVDARGQFTIEGLMPGTYELNAGLYLPGFRGETPYKKQEIVVTNGVVTNVTVTLDLSSLPARP
jgi:hypothetical protein